MIGTQRDFFSNFFFKIQIKPTNLNKESLWAQIDEDEIATDDVFDFLKMKYSATKYIFLFEVKIFLIFQVKVVQH